MFSKIVLVLGFAMISAAIAGEDCCKDLKAKCGNPYVCKYKDDHHLGPKCAKGKFKMFPTNGIKSALLRAHNTYRNTVAAGRLEPYESAKNMNKLKWNNDLASLCKLNVRQCDLVLDKCKTDKFRNPGENLGYAGAESTGKIPAGTVADVVKVVDSWFKKEAPLGNMDLIGGFKRNQKVQGFTQIVWAKATEVGCAASELMWKKGKKTTRDIYLCCKYNIGNVEGSSVYHAGKAASECKKGRSKKYRALCK